MSLLAILALAGVRGVARPTPTGWTTVPAPTPAIFASFPYKYRIGMEVEVPIRNLALIVDDLNKSWVPDAPRILAERPSLTLDYLNERTLADVRTKNPELAIELTKKLDTKRDVLGEILGFVEEDRAERVEKLRRSFGTPPTPGLILKQNEVIKPLNLGLQLAPTRLTMPKLEALNVGPKVIQTDWPEANARWNALDANVRGAAVDPELLAIDKKAQIVSAVLRTVDLRFAKMVPESDLAGLTKGGAAYLEPFKVWPDRLSAEFIHRKPVDSAPVYLDQLLTFARAINVVGRFRNPQGVSLRDTGYHLNFSVLGRRESIEPIVRAWRNLTVVKHLSVGLVNIFGPGEANFRSNIEDKGMVRLRSPSWVEVRDHFTDPETELKLLMELVAMPNEEAVRVINETLMPPITPAIANHLARNDRDAFFEILLGTPGIEVELSPSLAANPYADALRMMTAMELNPALVKNTAAINTFLGPIGARVLEERIMKKVYLTATFDRSFLPTYHEYLAQSRTCRGVWFFCAAAGRTAAKIKVLHAFAKVDATVSRVVERSMDGVNAAVERSVEGVSAAFERGAEVAMRAADLGVTKADRAIRRGAKQARAMSAYCEGLFK